MSTDERNGRAPSARPGNEEIIRLDDLEPIEDEPRRESGARVLRALTRHPKATAAVVAGFLLGAAAGASGMAEHRDAQVAAARRSAVDLSVDAFSFRGGYDDRQPVHLDVKVRNSGPVTLRLVGLEPRAHSVVVTKPVTAQEIAPGAVVSADVSVSVDCANSPAQGIGGDIPFLASVVTQDGRARSRELRVSDDQGQWPTMFTEQCANGGVSGELFSAQYLGREKSRGHTVAFGVRVWLSSQAPASTRLESVALDNMAAEITGRLPELAPGKSTVLHVVAQLPPCANVESFGLNSGIQFFYGFDGRRTGQSEGLGGYADLGFGFQRDVVRAIDVECG